MKDDLSGGLGLHTLVEQTASTGMQNLWEMASVVKMQEVWQGSMACVARI
ncbi:MAG: hypothetical protein JRJ47_03075 [Deltaproteobacteria bacterium]|nr:hypothetical protein [Deltaproteobacteria bacterium]